MKIVQLKLADGTETDIRVRDNGDLDNIYGEHVDYDRFVGAVTLDGQFTVPVLEAIIAHMKAFPPHD